MRLINTSTQMTEILYKGKLESEEPGDFTRTSEALVLEEGELPTVEISQPQSLNIAGLYREEGKLLPAAMRLLLTEADFFLVEFACTFHMENDSPARIRSARFITELHPKQAGIPDPQQKDQKHQPVAFDLYPERMEEESQRDIHITFSPSLKFTLLEAALESVVDIHHTQLIPRIIAGGIRSDRFWWELYATDHYALQGSRQFSAIIKSPKQAGGVHATFYLQAHILTPRGWGKAVLRYTKDDARARLSCDIGV